MKSILFLLLLSFSLSMANAQGYRLLNPDPTSNDIKTVSFPTTDTGFISDGSFLFRTFNAGESWEKIPFADNISDVKFINSLKGFAIASHAFYKTEDCGDTWERQYIVSESPRSIYFLNDSVGYLFGWGTYIGKTVNGGDSWENLSGSYSWLSRNLQLEFVDENTGYRIFEDGDFYHHLYKTIDGGLTWTELTVPEEPLSISARSSDEFWLSAKFYSPEFPCPAFIYHTIDGGITWDSVYYGITHTMPYAAESVRFFNDLEAVVINGLQTFTTSDGGNTWLQHNLYEDWELGTNSSTSSWPDPVNGIIGGTHGMLLRTNDRGETYSKITYGFHVNFNAVHFTDSLHGCVAGTKDYESVILKTVDGGITWDSTSISNIQISDIHFTDSLTGWLTSYSVIFQTIDGGSNWNLTYSSFEGDTKFSALTIPDKDHLYVNDYNAISFSNDQGFTWFDRTPAGWMETHYLTALEFTDGVTGYCAVRSRDRDSSNVLLKTTNGGIDWTIATEFLYSTDVKTIDFYDEFNGTILFYNGPLVTTHDGGITWNPYPCNYCSYLKTIDSQTTLVVNGASSTMVSYDGGVTYITTYDGNGSNYSFIRDTWFLDENHGFHVGLGGLILSFDETMTGISGPSNWDQYSGMPLFHPNPAKETIILSTGEAWTSVKIHTISGRLVTSLPANAGCVIDISYLPKGIYLLTATGKNTRKVEKLVKM